MNFAQFTGHMPAANALPIHQFAAKLGYDNNGGGGVVQETRYHNGAGNNLQFAVSPSSGQLTVEGVKFRQAESVVVVSGAQPGTVTFAGLAPLQVAQYHRKKLPSFEISFEKDMGKCVEVDSGFVNAGVKYQAIASSTLNHNIAYGQTSYMQAETVHQMKEERVDRRDFSQELHHDLIATMMQQHQVAQPLQQGQNFLVVLHEPKDAAALARVIKNEGRQERNTHEFISIGDVTDTSTWQTLSNNGVAEYLSSLPLPLHQLLKYAPPDCKEQNMVAPPVNDSVVPVTTITQVPAQSVCVQTTPIEDPPSPVVPDIVITANKPGVIKKKKKSGGAKEKRARLKPGEIRLTTALDGSTLYCCPECHMAYPERGMLEQHLLGHTMERKFICDICNAALKRKDHLTRHKQSHYPERPHVCSVCHKGFKRKEQLTLHFVIHSGEKRHTCIECGKGFYRKDHLRKHTRSHIARRVKAEMSQRCAPAVTPKPEPAPS